MLSQPAALGRALPDKCCQVKLKSMYKGLYRHAPLYGMPASVSLPAVNQPRNWMYYAAC